MSDIVKTGRPNSVRKRLMFAAGLSALCAFAMPAFAVNGDANDKSASADKKVKIVSNAALAGGKAKKVVADEPAGAAAEAVRALRTHVMAQHVQKGRRALAI